MGFYFASPIKQWACFLVLRCPLPLAFQVCLSLFFSAVSQASPPLSSDVHFCRVLGAEDMLVRDSLYAATKQALNLNVGEPRTVRMIYFLPNDRPFQQEVVDSMKVTIRQIQTFYAEQMQAHGYGNKTFRFETDAQGEPVVHRVDGQHPDSHYLSNTYIPEINKIFNVYENIYLIIIDSRRGGRGLGERQNKNSGIALLTGRFSWTTAAHELGHAFGLQHDFRDNAYIMSYGPGEDRLSACNAEYLTIHPYFNLDTPIEAAQPPTIELISPNGYPPGSKSVSIQLKVSDSDGLHQVILFVKTRSLHPAAGFLEVKACRGLTGERDTVVEFDYDGIIPSDGGTSLFYPTEHPISVEVVDTDGNVSRISFELWEVPPQHITTLEGHTGEVFSVAFSPDRTMLASGSEDKTVRVWNVATGETIATLEGHTREVRAVAFSPDSTTLASGSFGDARLWDVVTKETVATPAAYSHVWSMAFSPDGATLAYVSWRDVRLWDVATRRDIGVLQGHTSSVGSIAFSPDGTTLASGSFGDINLWDVATGGNVATFELPHGGAQIRSIAFSPDGTTLASGAYDATIGLLNISTGENIATILGGDSGNTSAVCVAYSPDGTTLASGSTDRVIKIWDVATKEISATLKGHRGRVWDIEFSLDGRMLASGSSDGTVILWDTSEWARPRPRTLIKISGDSQQGTPGAELANPYVVEVRDQYGAPLQGAQVAFTVTVGDGRLSGQFTVENAITDANGRAQSTLTPGPGTNTVEASVAGIEVTFKAVVVGMPTTPVIGGDYQRWHLPDGAIARLGKGRVNDRDNAVAFSPNGQRLAVASDIGIWLYDVGTSRELALLTGHTHYVSSVSFSPDGTLLASGSRDKTVKLWNIATGENITTLEGHTRNVDYVAFSSNGKTLASWSFDGTVRLWDVSIGETIAILDIGGVQVAYSPDGTTLASGANYGSYSTLELWDVSTGEMITTLERHRRQFGSIAFSPDGTTLASAVGGRTVKLWDVATRTTIATLKGHTRDIESIAFSSDGKTLASGSYDKTVKLWDVSTGENIATLEGHTSKVTSIAFSSDGKTLASVSWDGTINLWDIEKKNIAILKGHTPIVNSVAYSPDGTTLASGPWAGPVKLWDIATGQNIATLEGSSRFVTFSPHGKTLATISEVGAILLWDVSTGENIATLIADEHSFRVTSIAFSPDGKTLASGSGGRTVDLWDVAAQTHTATLEGHTEWVNSVAFSPDGKTLASGASDNTVKLWDVAAQTHTATLEGHTEWVNSVAFSPDGKTLASGSYDKTVKLWDVATRTNIATFEGHTGHLYSVAFSPDGAALASGSEDQTVKLWDVDTGQNIATFEGHTGHLYSVAFSPGGTTLSSGAGDGSVLLWDMSAYVSPVVTGVPVESPTPDFDGDGTVGISDFLLFATQFGLSRGDAGYDARFDLDGNGSIGISDFLIFVNAFGE